MKTLTERIDATTTVIAMRKILHKILTEFLDNPSVDAYNDVKDAMKEFAREH